MSGRPTVRAVELCRRTASAARTNTVSIGGWLAGRQFDC